MSYKTHFIISILLLLCNLTQAHVTEPEESNTPLGIIHFNDTRYKNFTIKKTQYIENLFLLMEIDNSNSTHQPLQIVVKMNAPDSILPSGYLTSANTAIVEEVNTFEQYENWTGLIHKTSNNTLDMYIQPLPENQYTVTGSITRNGGEEKQDTITFSYTGEIASFVPEVTRISSYLSSHPKSKLKKNIGNITFKDDTIKTPFAVQIPEEESTKIYLYVRSIFEYPENVQHAISFDFKSNKNKLPTGTFTYSKGDSTSTFTPAFFDNGATNHPKECKLLITRKKDHYHLTYNMTFDDDTKLSGVFSGVILIRSN